MIGAGPPGGSDSGFETRLARSEEEVAAYFQLRRAIFCDEQGIFAAEGGADRDQWDGTAFPIVCLERATGRVVGVVRIWQSAPGHWWGGRLGVAREFRTVGAIGRWLVQTAVGTARAWGATRFQATVQRPNVAFFRRLHWRSLEEQELHGQLHHLMEAELARYTPLPGSPHPGAAPAAPGAPPSPPGAAHEAA